jgi:DNA-damage-inducible protein J
LINFLSISEIVPHNKANTTDAINLFYTQIKLHHGLPFNVKIPNTKTVRAMKELKADRGKNKFKTYDSAKDMFKDMDL